jgi:hypothetical protein
MCANKDANTHSLIQCFNIRQIRRGKEWEQQKITGEICALLGHYAAYGGNSLPTFPDKLYVPSSRVNKSKVSCNAYYPKRQRISSTSYGKKTDKLKGKERDTGGRMEELKIRKGEKEE